MGLVACHLLKCSFCTNCGLEKAVPGIGGLGAQFQCRLVRFGPGTDVWRSCRFIGALSRALCALPGGISRFVLCDIGANHLRLRHIGWEKCGHGLTSRPRESASEGSKMSCYFFLDTVLGPLLLSWRVLCLFGTVLVGLPVGFPLGAFLLMVTLQDPVTEGVRKLVL